MRADIPAGSGVNVIGYVSSNSGLGVSARQITKLLLDKGYPIAVLDLEPGAGRGRHDLSFDSYAVGSGEDLRYGINLVVLAVPSLPSFFLEPPAVLPGHNSSLPGFEYWLDGARLNVAVVWWELGVLPDLWIRALELFDVVVGPSPFIQATLEAHLSNTAIIPAIHPFDLPHGIEPSRSRFGLPDDAVLFETSFEPSSDPERKNPFAVIDAFQRAFPNDARANLVVKLNNSRTANDRLRAVLKRLRERCAGDGRIRVIDDTLSYSEVLCLHASCDVFVSLHRSEGLGFGLMEAMSLGKPIIATGWSGNMAFMDHTNSCLVRYKLIPVRATVDVYTEDVLGKTAMWADPDLDEAAAWMKKLVDDPEQRLALGRRAASDMAGFQQKARKAEFLDEMEAIRRNDSFLTNRALASKLTSLQSLRQAMVQQQESVLPYWRRSARRLRRSADRHLLWRFR